MELFRDGRMPFIIFCDGACSGNPGPGGWGTVVATPAGEIVELGGGDKDTTNNRMELIATVRGIEFVGEAKGDIDLFTDSTYVIRGITEWIFGWRKRGWKNAAGEPVANKEIWEKLSAVVGRRKGLGELNWRYVRGHTGVPGNERVDAIAVAHSQGKRPPLYRGSLKDYGIAILDIPDTKGELPEMRPKEVKAKAHSYLSLVGGVAKRHVSWSDCERRVKGVSGARFKKAMSASEEKEILASWGARVEG